MPRRCLRAGRPGRCSPCDSSVTHRPRRRNRAASASCRPENPHPMQRPTRLISLAAGMMSAFAAHALDFGEDGGHGPLSSLVAFLLVLFGFVIVPLVAIASPFLLIWFVVRLIRRRRSPYRDGKWH